MLNASICDDAVPRTKAEGVTETDINYLYMTALKKV